MRLFSRHVKLSSYTVCYIILVHTRRFPHNDCDFQNPTVNGINIAEVTLKLYIVQNFFHEY
jgi:hypothetical protein